LCVLCTAQRRWLTTGMCSLVRCLLINHQQLAFPVLPLPCRWGQPDPGTHMHWNLFLVHPLCPSLFLASRDSVQSFRQELYASEHTPLRDSSPKNKNSVINSVIIIHLYDVPNFFEVLSSEENILAPIQLTVAIDLLWEQYYGSQWVPSTIYLTTFFKISFMFSRRRGHPYVFLSLSFYKDKESVFTCIRDFSQWVTLKYSIQISKKCSTGGFSLLCKFPTAI